MKLLCLSTIVALSLLALVPNAGATTTYRPSSFTDSGDSPTTNPTNAYDGNTTTFAGVHAGLTLQDADIDYFGIPSATGTPTSLKLFMTASATKSGSTCTDSTLYSLDGVHTSPFPGQSGSRGQTTTSVTLSPTQDLTKIHVSVLINCSADIESVKVFEIWVEAQP